MEHLIEELEATLQSMNAIRRRMFAESPNEARDDIAEYARLSDVADRLTKAICPNE
jgi:hypothetical protein